MTGVQPIGPMVEGCDGFLYGATAYSTLPPALGTIFRVNKDGTGAQTLFVFTNATSHGQHPVGGLIRAQVDMGTAAISVYRKALFGMTGSGGNQNGGVLFRLLTDGTEFKVLHHFPNGMFPPFGGALLLARDGWLYGTTIGGGTHSQGTIFRITREGAGFQILHHFQGGAADGAQPYAGVIEGNDEFLYGTTAAGGQYAGGGLGGTVYKIAKDGTGFSILRHFPDPAGDNGTPDGARLFGGVIQASDGYLYGANDSTAFRIRPNGTDYRIVTSFGGPSTLALTDLTEAPDGNLYSVSSIGSGGLYRLVKPALESEPWLYEALPFAPTFEEGATPFGRLILASDGGLYGAALTGNGDAEQGVVFRWMPGTVAPARLIKPYGAETLTPPVAEAGGPSSQDEGSPNGFGQASLQAMAEIALTNVGAGFQAGRSVALMDDLLVVGAPFGTNESYYGAAAVFARDANGWSEQTNLAPVVADGTFAFGYAVALNGTNLVVGALESFPTNQNSGSVFVFGRNEMDWSREARLMPSDGAPDDQFGAAVAMDGETILVGAPLRDEAGTNAGAAYVFVRDSGNWTQQAKLLPAATTNAFFGGAVAVRGDTAFVSAPQGTGFSAENRPGEVHVYTRSDTAWSFQQKLGSASQFPRDLFGANLAVLDDTLVIGAPGIVPFGPPPDANFGQRAAYVFVRDGATWIERQKLSSSDLAAYDIFGCSVGVAEDYIVVGAPHSWPFSAAPHDAAYAFRRVGNGWQQALRMEATEPQMLGAFGFALAIDGGTLAVGAPAHTNSTAMRGSVYVFDLPPVLNISRENLEAVITWSVAATGYALETTTNLNVADSWQAILPTPVGNTHRALIEQSARFYRLKRQ